MVKQRQDKEKLKKLIDGLSSEERAILMEMLSGETSDESRDMDGFIAERRFSGGRVCPICGGVHVQRNGHRVNGSQKYVCRDCGKTFSIRKNTVFEGTRKDMATWERYVECMAQGLSLDKSAAACGITHATAFVWRHKILDALGVAAGGNVCLSGIVEADETFRPVSYKGDAKRFSDGEAGRKARKRGGGNHTRGLSDELVCVPCAVDRKGNAVSRVAKLGKCSAEAVGKVLGGRVDKGSTLCTDGDKSYRRFSASNGNGLVQVKGGREVKGIFHIQHVNAYHRFLGKFLDTFHGVSTKYLNNYLTWNNAVVHTKAGFRQKIADMLNAISDAFFSESSLAVPKRPPIPILVKNQSNIKL